MKRKKTLVAIIILVVAFLVCAGISSKYKGDINTMPSAKLKIELEKLDGIGPVLADLIITNRPYYSWDDLKIRLVGIGDKRTDLLKEYFTIKEVPSQ